IEPRAKEAAEQLKQLGPAPGKDDAPESEDIAKQRKELTADAGKLEGDVKQGRVLLLRTDQLSERVSEKRHALYARELFAQTQSILDPTFWRDTANALPIECRRLEGVAGSWTLSVGDKASSGTVIAAVCSLLLILLVAWGGGRWLWPMVEGAHA